jgi:hypothetical protein
MNAALVWAAHVFLAAIVQLMEAASGLLIPGLGACDGGGCRVRRGADRNSERSNLVRPAEF